MIDPATLAYILFIALVVAWDIFGDDLDLPPPKRIIV